MVRLVHCMAVLLVSLVHVASEHCYVAVTAAMGRCSMIPLKIEQNRNGSLNDLTFRKKPKNGFNGGEPKVKNDNEIIGSCGRMSCSRAFVLHQITNNRDLIKY